MQECRNRTLVNNEYHHTKPRDIYLTYDSDDLKNMDLYVSKNMAGIELSYG